MIFNGSSPRAAHQVILVVCKSWNMIAFLVAALAKSSVRWTPTTTRISGMRSGSIAAARDGRLGRLDLALVAHPVDAPVHVHGGVLQVDVRPIERRQLACTRIRVDRERKQSPPSTRHTLRRDEWPEFESLFVPVATLILPPPCTRAT
jgi:hypothetical protein